MDAVPHTLKKENEPARPDVDADCEALDVLLPAVYEELRRVARRQRRRLTPGRTLDTTALVHEAYLKLSGHAAGWRGQSHLLAVAARAMRQILVDYARQRSSWKRGGGCTPACLDEHPVADDQARSMIALDLALHDLAAVDQRLVRIVECRVFAGFSEEETAQALATSLRTVQRDWSRARAWLRQSLAPGGAA